jgi:hypothetical protein
LLTPADLLSKGWRTQVGAVDDWSIVAEGRQFPAAGVSGVITLLPHVFEQELFDIEVSDRKYVAAEATAFALFFLSKIPCPVVNRPTPDCLTGPNWRPEQWASACFKAGIAARRTSRKSRESTVPPKADSTLKSVTVLGNRFVGNHGCACASGVRRLTELANVTFLQIYFTDENHRNVFYGARVIPDISKIEIRNALHEYFNSASSS